MEKWKGSLCLLSLFKSFDYQISVSIYKAMKSPIISGIFWEIKAFSVNMMLLVQFSCAALLHWKF